MSRSQKTNFSFKSIRDPLYGFIDLSETETKIINTRVFRRLHNIKQLSHAYLAYSTAIHTRFEHSLGVLYLADKISKQLHFDDSIREIVRLAGLLHDIGHGPFSHLFEEVIEDVNGQKIDHDKISMMLIKEDDEISELLGDKGEQIIQLLNHQSISGFDNQQSTLAADAVSGPLDADKMDYLRRDSYHIGVAYGQFDLSRVLHTLTSTQDPHEPHICVDYKGKDAIENYRLGRYLMHAQVYKQHTRIVGDQMFLRSLDLAINQDDTIEKHNLQTDTDLDKSHKEFLDFYTSLDDHGLYDLIIRKKPSSDAAQILKKLQQRKLLKRILDFLPDKELKNIQVRDRIMKMQKNDLRKMSNDIADYLHIPKQNIISYLSETQINLYEGEIMILWKDIPSRLDDFSPINTNTSTISKFYIFGPNDESTRKYVVEYVDASYGIKLS